VTYPAEVVSRAADLVSQGRSISEVSRLTGASRAAIREWLQDDPAAVASKRLALHVGHPPGACPWVDRVDDVASQYAYLLGLYLGDGCLSEGRRDVYRLRITCDLNYPGIIGEGFRAMKAVLPNRVGTVRKIGCLDLTSYSLHWPCLFPQHGPGPKHLRPIVLERWQAEVALRRHPEMLLRGLIHSDGCRVENRVWAGKYSYARYFFSNASGDIRGIFCQACDRVGVEHRQNNARNISVARRRSVELLDSFIGPKR
jgi:hypothetical protein